MTSPPTHAFHYPAWKQSIARLIEWAAVPLTSFIPKPDATTPRRILIMEPFLLGDTALLAVMIDPIRKCFPNAEIHFLISTAWADLYRHDPRVTAVHGWVFPWTKRRGKYESMMEYFRSWRFIRNLRKQQFDIGIDARGDVRSQVVLTLLSCKRRIGYTNYLCSNIRIRGKLLTDNLGDVPMQHVTEINLGLVGLLSKTDDVEVVPPKTPARLPALHSASPEKRSSFHIIIHTGAGWTYKRWPQDRWFQLLTRILDLPNVTVTLAGAPSEEVDLRLLREQTGNRVPVVITSLQEMVNLFAGTDLILCHDSGPMNVATMLGKPVIALFGPGVLPLYRPISPASICVEHQSAFPCAPCNQQTCIRPGDFCMQAITVEEVWAEVVRKYEG